MMAIRRSYFEIVIFSVLITLSVALSFAWYAKRHNNFKHQQLMVEQMALRQGVRLYRAKLGFFPADLKKVAPLLKELEWEGELANNPFGKEYHYDPKTGWID